LVSWCKFCPQVKPSAGKRKGRNARGRGNRYIAGALGEITVCAGRTKTRIGACYRRLAKRRGTAKAQGGLGNTILTLAHVLLSNPEAGYQDLSADYYKACMPHRRQVSNHIRELKRLGYLITVQPLDDQAA
jgi:hypothetical protein